MVLLENQRCFAIANVLFYCFCWMGHFSNDKKGQNIARHRFWLMDRQSELFQNDMEYDSTHRTNVLRTTVVIS